MVKASANSTTKPLAYAVQTTPMNCMAANTANRMCNRKRSTSRPTANCVIAPQMKTAVVRPPISTSEILLTRSSTIFGRATDSVLNTSPADKATTTKRPNIVAARTGDIETSGEALREDLWAVSSGMGQRYAAPVATQTMPGTKNAPRQDSVAVRSAVTPAASEIPILPHTPLKATVRPRWVALSITIAVPTG